MNFESYVHQRFEYLNNLGNKLLARISLIEKCIFNHTRDPVQEPSKPTGYVKAIHLANKYKFISAPTILKIIRDPRYTGRKFIGKHFSLSEYDFIEFMESGNCWVKKAQNNYNLLKDSVPELVEFRDKMKKAKESIQLQHNQL